MKIIQKLKVLFFLCVVFGSIFPRMALAGHPAPGAIPDNFNYRCVGSPGHTVAAFIIHNISGQPITISGEMPYKLYYDGHVSIADFHSVNPFTNLPLGYVPLESGSTINNNGYGVVLICGNSDNDDGDSAVSGGSHNDDPSHGVKIESAVQIGGVFLGVLDNASHIYEEKFLVDNNGKLSGALAPLVTATKRTESVDPGEPCEETSFYYDYYVFGGHPGDVTIGDVTNGSCGCYSKDTSIAYDGCNTTAVFEVHKQMADFPMGKSS